MSEDNLILLPRAIEKMKQDIQYLMKEKLYNEALDLLQMLLDNNIRSENLILNTLICMKELSRYEEAEELCEEVLLDAGPGHYLSILEYYMMLLLEMESYAQLIEVINAHADTMPSESSYKLDVLKLQAEQMLEEEKHILLSELELHIKNKNYKKAYFILQKWKFDQVHIPAQFYQLLKEPAVHPIIQTEVLLILREKKVTNQVIINKYGKSNTITPECLPGLADHEDYQAVLLNMEDLEQKNPSQYLIAAELLKSYAYNHYPLYFGDTEPEEMAEKLCQIASATLDPADDLIFDDIMLDILKCHSDYHVIISE